VSCGKNWTVLGLEGLVVACWRASWDLDFAVQRR